MSEVKPIRTLEKIAYTGAHGTGKTTSVAKLFYELKLANNNKRVCALYENASRCPYPINKDGTTNGQYWIFTNQLSKELDLCSKYDIVITDRTIVDSIAYSQVTGLISLVDVLVPVAIDYISTYTDIRFKTIKNNPYFFEDGVRDHKDIEFRQKVEDAMLELYDYIFAKRHELRFMYTIE